MCWYPSEARVATLLSCLGLFLAVRAAAFAMSGIPSSQGASEAARGFPRDYSRPAGDRSSKASPSAAAGAAAAGGGGGGSPSHLVVLVHGLGGTPEDLSYLKESLDRRGGEGVLVHLARCNQGKTKDGVAMGGKRLASEVKAIVERTPSLARISLVGNSLGGLYVRYAVKLLYRAGGGGGGGGGGGASDASAAAAEVTVGGGGSVNGSGSADGFSTTAATTTVTAAATAATASTSTPTSSSTATTTAMSPENENETPTNADSKAATVTVKSPAAARSSSSASKAPEEGHVPKASSSPVEEGKEAAMAAAVAAAREGETVAGLKPSVFMTIASPHLGVRRFTYVPLPTPLHALASVFVGKTGSDLFLERNGDSSAALVPPPPPPPAPSLSPSAISSAVRRYFSLFPGDSDSKAVGKGSLGAGTEARAGAGTGTGIAAGKTGREASLLYEMATSEEFLTPLKAFRWRRAYANRRGDFMVPYETAAFVSPGEGDGSETTTTPPTEAALAGGVGEGGPEARATVVGGGGQGKDAQEAKDETEEVDTGATVSAFTVADRVLGAKHGAIVGMARVPPAARMAGAGAGGGAEVVGMGVGVEAAAENRDNGGGAGLRDEGRAEAAPGGVAVAARVAVAAGVAASGGGERPVRPGRTRIFVGSKASARTRVRKTMEEEMADGLNSCGWEKVSVDFGGLAPFSHNKICALSRSPLTRAVFRSGMTVVDHAANFLVSYDLKEDLKNGGDGGGDGGGGSHGG